MSGGLKGLCTFLAWQGIEDLRKCCGGNGYLMSSGIAPLAANYVWQSTAEGDWTLLMLQTAQFLLKSINNAVQGKQLSETVAYLTPLSDPSFGFESAPLPVANGPEDFTNLQFLIKIFQGAALLTVAAVGQQFQQKIGEHNGRFDEAFNSCAIELVNAVRSHCYAYILIKFVKTIQETEDSATKAALTEVCTLFACSNILDDPQWSGLISLSQMQIVKDVVPQIMERIRPNAIALTDAFDFADNTLMSAVGKFDGNVYEALYETALKAPLNQTDPFDGYKEYLQPHLDLEFLKKGNTVPAGKSSKL